MIKSAKAGKAISVTVMNKIGVLADMSKVLADHGLNIEAAEGYTAEGEANIMIVTDDNLRSKEALIKAGYKGAKENPIIIVELEDKPGALKILTAKLAAENIDIRYLFGTTCSGDLAARIILSTNDDEKALVVFNK